MDSTTGKTEKDQPPTATPSTALADGRYDEALQRLHRTGPEYHGGLSNHGPMVVEALARHDRSAAVHRWLDVYTDLLDDVPAFRERVTDENWTAALGDRQRVTDWTAYFAEQVAEQPWREVLALWWPRLLPGIAGGATHPVIRVGHAVRTLLADGETGPRVTELAHALGYWAARHTPLPVTVEPTGDASPGAALRGLPRIADQNVRLLAGLRQLPETEGWAEAAAALRVPADPQAARARLAALVRAATAHYLDYGHGEPVLLVHAATAPNAVLRTLPALPPALWAPSLGAAWAASAALVSCYTPGAPLPALRTGPMTPEEVFARAADHGDAHAVKFTDTALDVTAGLPGAEEPPPDATDPTEAPASLVAAARVLQLIPPGV